MDLQMKALAEALGNLAKEQRETLATLLEE